MRLIFTILFVQFLNFAINAQNYINLYHNFLPKTFLSLDEESRQMYEAQFKGKLEVNPALAYSLIEHINRRYGQSIVNEEDNLLNHHRYLTAKYYTEKNHWLNVQVLAIQKNFPNNPEKSTAIRFLNNNSSVEFNAIESNVRFNYDKNKEAFFTYMYFVSDSSLKYDSSNDYSANVLNYRKKIMDVINLECSYDFEEDKTIDASDLIKNWIALKTFSGVSGFKYSEEYFLDYFSKYSYDKLPFQVGIFSGTIYNMISKVEQSYRLPVFDKTFSFIKKFPDVQYNLGIDLTYHFSQKPKLLSYLRLEGETGKNISQKTEIINQPYTETGTDYNSIMEENRSELTLTSQDSWFIKLTVPIYYITNYLCVDAGIQYVKNTMHYTWLGNYTFKIENNGEYFYNEHRYYANGKYKVVTSSLLPVVELSLYPFNKVYIRLSGTYNYFGIKAGYIIIPTILNLFGE